MLPLALHPLLTLWHPRLAGKIAWARQLFRRIQEPMDTFTQHELILQSPDAKRIIKNYNRLAKVLLEFEVLYHRGWMRQVRRKGQKQLGPRI